jgi:hypothetical protein
MNVGRLAARLGYSVAGALMVVGSWQPRAAAQDGHGISMAQHHPSTPEDKARTSALVAVVRDATRRFLDPAVALAEGYVPQFGCVSGSSEGAMGVHFVNSALVGDPALNPSQPELLVYEPQPNNRFQLVAADYLVLSAAWQQANPDAGPPQLMGQLFHLFESPNRFGLPEFFTLHVWAWRDNPQGTFANWNPNVSCDAYNPRSH